MASEGKQKPRTRQPVGQTAVAPEDYVTSSPMSRVQHAPTDIRFRSQFVLFSPRRVIQNVQIRRTPGGQINDIIKYTSPNCGAAATCRRLLFSSHHKLSQQRQHASLLREARRPVHESKPENPISSWASCDRLTTGQHSLLDQIMQVTSR
jgi:hypothetical protein